MTVKLQIFWASRIFLQNYSGKIGIILNKNERMAKDHHSLRLRSITLGWLFLGADTLAEKKPSPLPLQTMMQMAQTTPDNTIMIGDGTPDMVSAQRAGVRSIAIRVRLYSQRSLRKI